MSRSIREDYLNESPLLRPFYRVSPHQYDVHSLVNERLKVQTPRSVLADVLENQYEHLPTKPTVNHNIALLRQENTFTITTGQQPVLFGGPMYVLYKAITTITIAQEFKSMMPEANFVPVFWMASEDHDWQEVNHTWIGFKDKKIYDAKCFGAVGRHKITDRIQNLLTDDPVIRSYWKAGITWADAFQATLHHWLGDQGLVVLNPDVPALKNAFLTIAQQEFYDRPSERLVLETSQKLSDASYPIQLTPRPINLFYLTDQHRGRMTPGDNGNILVDKTDLIFSRKLMMEHVCDQPETVSPNAVLRPIYQETILPNLVYVGGWGEIAYWMELGSLFEHYNLPMPMIMPRASALLWTQPQWDEWKNYGLTPQDLNLTDDHFKKQALSKLWNNDPFLEDWSEELANLFDRLHDYVGTLTPQQQRNVSGQLTKNVHFTETLRKKMTKMILRQHPLTYQPILRIKSQVQPDGSVQERCLNPSSFPGFTSDQIVAFLLDHLDSFDSDLQQLILR